MSFRMTTSPGRGGLRWLLVCLPLLLAGRAAIAKITLSGVTAVNVNPGSFSIIGDCSSVIDSNTTVSVSVFADAAGVTNLAGQLGLEFYPLQTGSPGTTNSYDRRLDEESLRQNTMNLGLVSVRVSGCSPATLYYYSLQVSKTNGQQAVWPVSGPLPSVTTPLENAFVLQSEQVVLSLGETSPAGAIILLSSTNTPNGWAAVVGDGAGTNQAFFSLNELLAATGNTNVLPSGTREFTATVLGLPSVSVTQSYTLDFSTNFVVGGSAQASLGSFVALTLGSNIVLVGQGGNIPINLQAETFLTNFSFTLSVPTNRFSSLSLQPLVPQVASASLSLVAPDTLRLAFASGPGQNLQGFQDIAQLNFVTASNQDSAFVPLVPQTLLGTNADASVVSQAAVQPGRLVIVGPQSLLEALRTPGGGRSLALYGRPGASYQIQSATDLSQAGNWTNLMRVPLTNILEVFPLDTTPPVVFYRAQSFNADPPLLEPHLENQSRSLLVYGLAGSNYTLLYSTNLASGAAWSPVLSFTLTNSFQLFTNLGNAQPRIFYRLRRP